jgi:hypothetical protein
MVVVDEDGGESASAPNGDHSVAHIAVEIVRAAPDP